MPTIPRPELQIILQVTEDSFPHDLCATCECFLGYLAQLRIDSNPADKSLFFPYKVERRNMHKCLGCDPCPPGELYAEYMRERQNLISL